MEKKSTDVAGVVCSICTKLVNDGKVLLAHFTLSNGKLIQGQIFRLPCGCVEMIECLKGVPLATPGAVKKYKTIEILEANNPRIKIQY